jgi:hypothetical protein
LSPCNENPEFSAGFTQEKVEKRERKREKKEKENRFREMEVLGRDAGAGRLRAVFLMATALKLLLIPS